MSGFGRKGLESAPQLTPGQAMALRATPVQATEPQEPIVSPQLAAFLAGERAARRQVEPGLSDVALEPRASLNEGRTAASSATASGVDAQKPERSMVLAYVLWWFAAPLGAHRHYLGAHVSGFVQMGVWIAVFACMMAAGIAGASSMFVLGMTLLVGSLIWFIGDAFAIPGMLRQFRERPQACTFA
jgi:TM2 domain-containing membrane protein YozV